MSEATTRVVNIRTLPADPREWPADHVYIGRRVARAPYLLHASIWMNPWAIGPDGTRERVLALHEQYIADHLALRARVGELKGKVLVCWCKPEACHGDVLARLADEMAAEVGLDPKTGRWARRPRAPVRSFAELERGYDPLGDS